MKIVIDTNIALDVLLNRTEFIQSSHDILKLSAQDKVSGFLTTNTITDMFYVLYKNSNETQVILQIHPLMQ